MLMNEALDAEQGFWSRFQTFPFTLGEVHSQIPECQTVAEKEN